ncbi:MAG: M56 family metallopeptidase, partial [Chitinophagaceae bacterium]|nr:M56 family metallopeptidase [Chitinophagaceae bacterium]
MSFFFAYLIKFSISLAAVYLFYRFVLRRITFYNWNRWYLLGYTLLSFFIAAINITPLLQENQLADNKTILWVPALDLYGQGGTISNTAVAASHSLSASDWILFIIAAGTIILLVRLFIQYLSFLRIRSKAQLLSGDGMRIYQVNRDIIPFSFGNSIFINQELHTEEELQKIIRHEFVHVKQRHSIDILWGEFLCIINWFNPFAWLLRNSIRQNLEFIADNKVVSNGIDRKQYQYLLLKVIGNNHFSIASKFNFSSLKKRIAMMNKLRSAKVHLLKFLFLLPVAVVMLLAFRNKDERRSTNAKNVLQDTVPVNNVKLPDAIRSLSVKQVSTAPASKIAGGQVVVTRKDGKTEIYDLDDNKSLSSFEKKYGVSLEEIIPPPPPSPAEPTEMVAPQRTINSKGYLIDIVGFDGTCTVLVIDKSGKEVEQVTLDEWDADSKYEEKYGEILPPPPPVFALAPAAPTVPVEAVTGTLYSCGSHHYNCVHTSYNCKPTGSTTTPAPVALVVGEGYGISSTISRDYEITDKKAT